MNLESVEIKKNPFIHILINNFFNKEEYDNIWKELIFLQLKMLPASMTGSSSDSDGTFRKKNMGLFLNHFYADSKTSLILNLMNSKMLCLQFKKLISSIDDLYYKLYDNINFSGTLVQSYTNGDYYKTHADDAIFSSTLCLHKNPKKFEGGMIHFPKYDYYIDLEDNQLLLFPSPLEHRVTQVKMKSSDATNGRFTITNFYYNSR